MDLDVICVQGFRRFRQRSVLKTGGKVVALVGPNEAGKSSLLQAIELLGNDDDPPASALSRGASPSELLIEGHFFLTAQDIEEAHLDSPSWFIVRKKASGGRQYDVRPPVRKRNLVPRGQLWQSLNFVIQNRRFRNRLADEFGEVEDAWEDVSIILKSEEEDLGDEQIASVVSLVDSISGHADPSDAAKIRNISGVRAEWQAAEESPNPRAYAISVLSGRLPIIAAFDDDERDLKSEYSIPELANGVPAALESLFLIANLSTAELIGAHQIGDTARLTTLEHAANKNLQEGFGDNWRQSGVYVTMRIQGDVIAVQVVNERSEFTSFAERSDGLRQFVALQSFSTCNWTGTPVLLIDEAEQKLHYDAQADLVQMLARQDVASKVIFTTHSAGCLPEDLGNGVRLVRPSGDDQTKSEVINKFWADNEPGLVPLLFGMGASTLAFFPTRNAVMVEGPSDMLLLPTMFREALAKSVLGFQFVPGLSQSNEIFHAPAIGRKSGILFLTDGDHGGDAIRASLLKVGVDPKSVFALRTRDRNAIDVEDFVEPDLLRESVNALLKKFHGAAPLLDRKSLVARHRMATLEKWFAKATGADLPKVELAYEILEAASDDPSRSILDPKRKSAFAAVAKAILERFTILKN